MRMDLVLRNFMNGSIISGWGANTARFWQYDTVDVGQDPAAEDGAGVHLVRGGW